MKNFKWGTESFNDKPIYVVLFVSRNKDNAEIEGFVERRTSFITHKTVEELQIEFSDFISHGKPGEFCRMYYSINPRDPVKIHKQLLHFLIDEPDFNLCCMNSKLAGIAASKECNAGKRWMFDFDMPSYDAAWECAMDIAAIDPDIEIHVKPTPHGYAIITSRGFDTRKLFEKWTNEIITLKRDDLLCVAWDITDKPDY